MIYRLHNLLLCGFAVFVLSILISQLCFASYICWFTLLQCLCKQSKGGHTSVDDSNLLSNLHFWNKVKTTVLRKGHTSFLWWSCGDTHIKHLKSMCQSTKASTQDTFVLQKWLSPDCSISSFMGSNSRFNTYSLLNFTWSWWSFIKAWHLIMWQFSHFSCK